MFSLRFSFQNFNCELLEVQWKGLVAVLACPSPLALVRGASGRGREADFQTAGTRANRTLATTSMWWSCAFARVEQLSHTEFVAKVRCARALDSRSICS